MKKTLLTAALLISSAALLLSGCILDATGTGPSETVAEPTIQDYNSGGVGDESGTYKGGHEPVFGCWGGSTFIEIESPDGSINIIEIPAFCDPYWSIKYHGDPDPTEVEDPGNSIDVEDPQVSGM
jgi:hypothetical protein